MGSGGRRSMPCNAETRLREADDYRAILHESGLAQVVDSSVSADAPPPCGYEQGYQVALAYFGLFQYNIGHRSWLIDPNRALFISPGWEYVDEHPVRGLGHASVLVNPSREVLDEICGGPGPNKNSAFMVATRPATMRLMLLTHHILDAAYGWNDPLHNDEWVVHVLHEAINGPDVSAPRASRAVERAKELLHAYGCERLSLDDIAQQVGVTAVYLTQEFARSEGTPLYRYQLRLRLSRALLELPYCDDITGLALDLGFSSHSHFTAAFRQAFGMTPSEYRSSLGRKRLVQRHGIGRTAPIRRVA